MALVSHGSDRGTCVSVCRCKKPSRSCGGYATKRARRAAKDLVLEEEYGLFLEHENRKDRRTNAVFVAGAIKDAVNERLEMVHLEPYTEGSLRKALGPIIKKHRQAH